MNLRAKRYAMVSELPKTDTKAKELIDSFALELAKCLKEKKSIQLTLEVNLSSQGGICRSWLRTQTQTEIK
jgi:hypothetical protein